MAGTQRWQGFGRFAIAALKPRSLGYLSCRSIGRQRFFVGIDVPNDSGQIEVISLDDFAKVEKGLRPCKDQYEQRESFEKLLNNVCDDLGLGGHFRCYGSAVNGTWMRGSDIDMTWLLKPPVDLNSEIRSWEFDMLRTLQSKIDSVATEPIDRTLLIMARVPVLKLFDSQGSVLCDITMNNWEGIQNTKFVARLCEEVESLGSLVRLLKHWARKKGIADRSMGGFSTYTLVLMSAHYMQTASKPLISECEGNQFAKQIERIRADLELVDFGSCDTVEPRCVDHIVNVESQQKQEHFAASIALSGFFEMFGSLDFSRGGKVILSGGAPEKIQQLQRQPCKLVESPMPPPPPSDPPPPPPPAPPAQPLTCMAESRTSEIHKPIRDSAEDMVQPMYYQIGWPVIAKDTPSQLAIRRLPPPPPPPPMLSRLDQRPPTQNQRPPPPRVSHGLAESESLRAGSLKPDSDLNSSFSLEADAGTKSLASSAVQENIAQTDVDQSSQSESQRLVPSISSVPPPPLPPFMPPPPPPAQMGNPSHNQSESLPPLATSEECLMPPPPPPPPPAKESESRSISLPMPPPPKSASFVSFGSLQVFCPLTGIDVQRSKHADWRKLWREIKKAADVMRCNTRSLSEKVESLFSATRLSRPSQIGLLTPPPPPSSPPPPPEQPPPPPPPQAQPTNMEHSQLEHATLTQPPPPPPEEPLSEIASQIQFSSTQQLILRQEDVFVQAMSSYPSQLTVA